MTSNYPAELYAAVHSGTPGDEFFYRRVCSEGRDALELGCGAGRITSALRGDGTEVVGLDINAELLALAQARGLSVVQEDMRTFDLGRQFDRVLIPYNGLYCLLDENDWVKCFKQARAHLRPGGLLVFDGWAADAFHEDADPFLEDPFELVKTVEALGASWKIFERSEWSPGTQRIDAFYRHIPSNGAAPIDAVISQRYALSHQVEPLLAQAGLELVALLGNFDDQPFDADSDLLIAVATPRE